MLVGAHYRRCRLHTSTNSAKGRQVKYTTTKRSASAQITLIAPPGGIRVIVFKFSKGRHYGKHDRINSDERQDLVKRYRGDNE
jgi:hypothetical protein